MESSLWRPSVCSPSPHNVPGDADGKYGHSAATDRSWPRCGHMVTSVTRSNHFSGTDSQGGDELDQTVNCSNPTSRRPMYLRPGLCTYVATQKGRLMILWKSCFYAHYIKTTISFIEKKERMKVFLRSIAIFFISEKRWRNLRWTILIHLSDEERPPGSVLCGRHPSYRC